MKRATEYCEYIRAENGISIHALVKRATAVAHTGTVSDVDFNPRPREEGDTLTVTGAAIADISIHALVKRATYVKYAIGHLK